MKKSRTTTVTVGPRPTKACINCRRLKVLYRRTSFQIEHVESIKADSALDEMRSLRASSMSSMPTESNSVCIQAAGQCKNLILEKVEPNSRYSGIRYT